MKAIWKLTFNDFIAATAIQAFAIYSIWYIGAVIHNQAMVALFGSVAIINVLLTPFGGNFADHKSKIKIIKVTSIMRSLLFVIFFIGYFVSHDLFYLLLSLNFFLSIIEAFYIPAIESVTPQFANNEEELVHNNSLVSMATQTSTIAGAALSGIMILLFKLTVAYLFVLILLIISAIFVVSIKERGSNSQDEFEGDIQVNFLSAFWQTLKFPIVKILLPYAVIINLSFWVYWYLMPIYLSNTLSDFKFAYSLQDLIIGGAALLGGAVIFKYSKKVLSFGKYYSWMLLFQSVGIAFVPLMFYLMPSQLCRLLFFVIAWVFYGVFNFFSSMVFITYVQKKIPESHLGTVMGIIFALFGAIGPISSLLSGFFEHPTDLIIGLIALPILIIPILMILDPRVTKMFE